MKPIVIWLAGILALVLLLVLRGGFQRPVLFVVVAVMIITLVAGFIMARRP